LGFHAAAATLAKMKCRVFLLCCFLPLLCCAETARIIATGNALLEHVQAAMKLFDDKPLTQDEGVKASELAGYLAAFYDMAELGEATGANFKFKLRLDIPLSQTVRILDKYLRGHPERLHLPSALLVEDAYAEVFPNPDYKPTIVPPVEEPKRNPQNSKP
jgi:hypothetical protein